MFSGTSGYFWLDSWILASIVQLGTQRFCRTFLTRRHDPCGRQYDQMTQAARSGVANIAEGSARRKTSKETEMKLTDVARASLAELSGDYINWLLEKGQAPWSKDGKQARELLAVRLDRSDYGQDVVHDACEHILKQKRHFDRWLLSDDDMVVANALLILIGRTINMLNHQLAAQGEIFKEEGGFREKLTDIRLDSKAKQEKGPRCPECGKPMTKRLAKAGKNKGHQFWGCTGYPECRGVRPTESINSNQSTESNLSKKAEK